MAAALALADQVMERLGGHKNWDQTRYLTWGFFGKCLHLWDKWAGNIRFEEKGLVVLMNFNSGQVRAWQEGQELTQSATVAAKLNRAHRAWINDSYWLVMPYKLKDSGVSLKYTGPGHTQEGRPAELLMLTFKGVGVTPQNKYEVWVDQQDHAYDAVGSLRGLGRRGAEVHRVLGQVAALWQDLARR